MPDSDNPAPRKPSPPAGPASPPGAAAGPVPAEPYVHDTGWPGPAGPPKTRDDGYQHVLEGIQALHNRMSELERLASAGDRAVGPVVRKAFIPAWKRVTEGESRWRVAIAVAVAIALQMPLPGRLVLFRPTWLLPALEAAMIVTLTVMRPTRLNRESRILRYLSLSMAGVLSLANAWSAAHLVVGLVQGTEGNAPGPLLTSGAVIWLTNVIIFGLWYWEFDRGGAVARAHATKLCPDFLFPQMTSPDLAPADWEPMFGDYLYLSFTNATAFSPTDVMPLSRWSKAAMGLQASVSIVTVALVIARAVNILR